MKGFRIPFRENESHAAQLTRGLAKMPAGFIAQLCEICDGRGEYKQTYTLGCGGGTHRSLGDCDYCGSAGLMQGRKPAPASVVNQVLVAGAPHES